MERVCSKDLSYARIFINHSIMNIHYWLFAIVTFRQNLATATWVGFRVRQISSELPNQPPFPIKMNPSVSSSTAMIGTGTPSASSIYISTALISSRRFVSDYPSFSSSTADLSTTLNMSPMSSPTGTIPLPLASRSLHAPTL